MESQPLYGYTLQYTCSDDYKPSDIIFEGDVYVNPQNFIDVVNAFMEETLPEYKDENGDYYGDYVYEPLTMERLECLTENHYMYIFYEIDYLFTFIVVKHKIIC
jgi:hypothetical protein